MLFRSVSRDVLDQVTTLGSEQRWRLETGNVTLRDWKMRQFQVINDWSRPVNGLSNVYAANAGYISTTAGATFTAGFSYDGNPNFGGPLAANALFQPAATINHDFLTDGLDPASELGSVLDVNQPANSGLKMEIIGSVASAATNGHTFYVGGHRIFGDLSRWQPALNLK